MKRLFRTKICGIRCVEDALLASKHGADAVGLNFFAKSVRYVEPEVAEEITERLDADVVKVGVFVNHSPQVMLDLAKRCRLDILQLHGDETPRMIPDLQGHSFIPVIRVRGESTWQDVINRCEPWMGAENVRGFLLDAQIGNEYGGTGHQLDRRLAAKVVEATELPVILAGGLKPSNVAEAIADVRPEGVDVASGVEEIPGRKSESMMQDFIVQSKRAFRLIEGPPGNH